MTQLQRHFVDQLLPERLASRLAKLGVTAVSLDRADGQLRAAAIGQARWIEALIVESSQFADTASRLWESMTTRPGEAHEFWPGVWLTPFTSERRQRGGQKGRLLAGLMLDRQLLHAEQLYQICQARELDYRASIDRIDRNQLLEPEQVRRLGTVLQWMHEDSVEIDRRDREVHGLSEQLGESYEELSLLYKLANNMAVDQPPAHFLTDVCRELQQVVGLRWMVLQLTDGDTRMNDLAGGIFTAGTKDADNATLRRIGRQLMSDRADPLKPTIYEHTDEVDIPGLATLAGDLLVVPLAVDGQLLGVMFGGDKLDGSAISTVDAKLCSALANSMAIFIQNMMLFDDVQNTFLGTLHALTAAIDAKDTYTHGHSERVALMSRQLAVAAGLDSHMVERVYISALIHDVGKIGVPESVLCKPGRLTAEEFELIKLHPSIGARILQDIRQMRDLIPGVLYHHERWDGNGYPSGKAGDDIPLFGRIICLADSFDAMSSNRTYRKSLRHEDVIAEIKRCAGTQFDPGLASFFLELNFTPYFEMISEHQAQNMRRSA